MPLGTRDVLIAIRAKDQASRIIGDVAAAFGASGKSMDEAGAKAQAAGKQTMQTGGALLGLGAGMVFAGAMGLAFYKNMADASIAYNKEASLTLTQVREHGVGLEEIKDIGKRVATEIPVPFEQLQKSLFDIFSSTDLSAAEAEKALKRFSEAAVAGAVDVAKASQAGISMLNGFQLPITELDRVMDVQFKTVQLGRISYDELASTIGRAIPSANKAGASIEDLGGMMAFMTRNGLSGAMAATSAGRAFDLMTNPKFESKMNALGLTTKDAAGNFKPMTEVVKDLQGKLGNLNEGDRAKALKELTMGSGGTIQAMRFLDLAVKDTDGSLNSFTQQIGDSKGAMGDAYKIMADTPAAKLQKLKNNWEVLKTEIGDAIIPILEKLIDHGGTVVKWFNDLSPGMKDAIIYGGLIASVLLVVVGVVVAAAGAIMVLAGAWSVIAGIMAVVAFPIGLIVAAIVAVIAIGYVLWRNWDTISKAFVVAWNWVKDAFWTVVHAIGDAASAVGGFFVSLWNKVVEIWNGIKDTIVGAVNTVVDFVKNHWQLLLAIIIGPLGIAVFLIIKFWSQIKGFFEAGVNIVVNALKTAFDAVVNFFTAIPGKVAEFVKNFLMFLWMLPNNIAYALGAALAYVILGVLAIGYAIVNGVIAAKDGVVAAWNGLVDGIIAAWNWAVEFFTSLPGKVASFFVNAYNWITDKGSQIIQGLIDFAKMIWEREVYFWTSLPGRIIGFFTNAYNWLTDKGSQIISGLMDFVKMIWNREVAFWTGLPGRIMSFFNGAINWLSDKGSQIINGLMNSVKGTWNSTSSFLSGIPGTVRNFFNGAIDWLYNAGRDIILGLGNGIDSLKDIVVNKVKSIGSSAIQGFKDAIASKSPSKLFMKAAIAIPQGIEIGVDNGLGLVRNAMNRLTDVVTGSAIADAPTMMNNVTQMPAPVVMMPQAAQSTGTDGPTFNLTFVDSKANSGVVDDIIWSWKTEGK